MVAGARTKPAPLFWVVAVLFQFMSLAAVAQNTTHLNITAIGAAGGRSTIECWQITRPFDTSTDPGTAGTKAQQLGDTTNLTLTILPPKFDGGLHNAPAVQYVAFTSGLAVVTLPDSDEKATIRGGKYGLIIAADIAAVSKKGHITRYPSGSTTTALQIRMKDNIPPAHSILHKGACRQDELVGL
ncbi:hypothetical protein DPSP01_009192 [Paraphaeosphaeria sporulosa]|uniref:Uncharacterized protein n=1 Tax=Paraphaeosphaeria sporulosa TaxID=1460663 RepID=A0A177CNP0_9PLEO|nr:uncharacterized protein CC84DRAFT_1086370 [Paraphaeosphaeria sporulosa]OAG09155.1 hypothetical protein CC84DRAFT_1086370 [Paraphaeosphaeria sporulosa]